MFKRILSAVLVLATLVTFLPQKAMASETGTTGTGSSVVVEGTNSFGNLLANTVEEDPQTQEDPAGSAENRVCDLVIEGTTAKVEYAAAVNARLVVAVYTEDGSRMLGSGTAEVTPEETLAEMEIQADPMPRYFSAAAYLLDAKSSDPLSQPFRTSLYTKAVQDIRNSTVADYDPEKVLNLDGDATTNFAVFGDRTILVQPDSACVITGENGVYTVTNPDERFLAMEAGDSFAVTQEDGEVLIVAAARVEVKDNTVIVYENPDADLQDVFEAVKIEGSSNEDNMTYDDSGLDPELRLISEEEFLAETADAGDVSTQALVDQDKTKKFSKAFKPENKHLYGAFSFDLTASMKIYITSSYQYTAISNTISVEGKLTFEMESNKDLPLGEFGLALCPGVYVKFVPKIYFTASGAMTCSINWEASVGEKYDSNVGKWVDTSSPAKVGTTLELAGKIYVGVGMKVSFAVISEDLLHISIEAKLGATVSAKKKFDAIYTVSDSSIHPCKFCLEGKVDGSISVTLSYYIFGADTIDNIKKDPTKDLKLGTFSNSWKIADFFYCLDENEFGFTKCPHVLYRVTAKVLNDQGEPLKDAALRLCEAKDSAAREVTLVKDYELTASAFPEDTDESGASVFYLPNGSYRLEAASGSRKTEKNITVYGAATSVPMEVATHSLDMDRKNLDLHVDDTQQLQAAFSDPNGTWDVTAECTWTSSNPKVATVKDGLVTAVGLGDATVRAHYKRNGKHYSDPCYVSVREGTILAFGECGDNLIWRVIRDEDTWQSTLEISGYGDMWDYQVDMDSQTTTAPWYDYYPLTLNLDNRITRIGNSAFAYCLIRGDVILPDDLKEIGSYAFLQSACDLTGSLTIPSGVTAIGEGAFSGCEGFKGPLVLPKGLKSVEDSAFYQCHGFTGSLVLPEGIETIGDSAFDSCYGFTGDLVLPKTVKSVGNWAFYQCTGFTGGLILPEGLKSIGFDAFAQCTGFTGTLTLPNSLETLGKEAFAYCSGFAGDLVIPPDLTIEEDAFTGCTGLTGQLILQDGLKTIGDGAFRGRYGDDGFTGELVLPGSLTSIGKEAFYLQCGLTGTLVIPDSVRNIGSYAFGSCGFDSVFLSNQMTVIDGVFTDCENLTEVRIPVSVRIISANAFYGASNLKDVWYAGTENQWKGVQNESEEVLNATIHFSDGTSKSPAGGADRESALDVPEDVPETVEPVIPETTETPVPETTQAPVPETTEAPESTEAPETPETETAPETAGETIPQGAYIAPAGARREEGILVRAAAHTGKETLKNGVRTVAFAGLEPGEEYVLIVSLRPGSAAPADLQYIGQATASDSGSVQFAYIPRTEVSAIPQLYGIPARREITLDRDYLLLTAGGISEPLQATVTPEEWVDELVWSSENEDVLTVDAQGFVTPVAPGTGYAVATVTHGKYVFSARCRVDVTEKLPNEEVLSVDLGSRKVTSELYSTAYAQLDVLPRLAQNEPRISTYSAAAPEPENNGAAILSAYLVDEEAQKYFDLRVKDDRHLLLVPTEEALDASAKEIKGSYTSRVAVNINGVEYRTADAVTIAVKKTMPKLKAAGLTFNPFYTSQSQALNVTGGTVTAIEPNTQAKGYRWPDWLALEGTCLTLRNAPRSGSANLDLLVYTAEWSVPVSVKVPVKLSYKAPAVKLSASKLTLSDSASLGAALKLTAGKQSLEVLQVKSVTLPEGFRETALDLTSGEFRLVPEGGVPTGKMAVEVHFYGTEQSLSLPLTVSTKAPALKLSKSSLSLNGDLGDSVTLKVTAAPADLDLTRITVLNDNEDLTLSRVNAAGEFTVKLPKGTAPKTSYAVSLQAPTGKPVKLTVKTLAANAKVTMSLKASGTIDLTYPEKGVTLIPSLKNYSGALENVRYSLALKQGRETIPVAFADYLRIGEDDLLYAVGGLTAGTTAIVTMTGTLPDGSELSAPVQVKVTQTAVPLKLSRSSLSLNKKLNEWCTVGVSTTAKGYTLGTPDILVTEGKGTPTDALVTTYENGTLKLSLGESARYGAAYKVQLWATPNKVSTLTVKIPAEKASDVTVTAKASGAIDVARDSTEITVTPAYKNYLGQSPLARQAKILYAADGKNFTRDVTEAFRMDWTEDGKLHIRRAAELALTGKYRLELTVDGGTKPALAALTVRSGSAKLTAAPVVLYANDANSRAELRFAGTDPTLNPIARVELKNAKQADTYTLEDLGGGAFAIRFREGAAKKSGSVTLNVFCQGNTGKTPNASVTVKIEVR